MITPHRFPSPRRSRRRGRRMTEAQRLASCHRLAANMTAGRDYTGLHQGQVLNRWLRAQPPADRALLWATLTAIVFGLASLTALLAAQ